MNRKDAETPRIFEKIFMRFGIRRVLSAGVLALFVAFVVACSVPNLEQPECDQARDVIKEFYSYHFGHNLGFSEEDLNARRDYLTPEFLSSSRDSPLDPFTRMEDQPKAFRVGECNVLEPGTRTSFQVLLFWKDDVRSEQRSIWVEAEKRNGSWLIGKVGHENY